MDIKELPREMKVEKPIELDKSKIHPKWKKVLTFRHETKKGRVRPYENKKES